MYPTIQMVDEIDNQEEFITPDRDSDGVMIQRVVPSVLKEEVHFELKDEPHSDDDCERICYNNDRNEYCYSTNDTATDAMCPYLCSSNISNGGPLIVGSSQENNFNSMIYSEANQSIPETNGAPEFGSENPNVQILAVIPCFDEVEQDNNEDIQIIEEDEVQMQVSNKWIVSRGDNYVNLSILHGFPNPQVTKSISLTREGIQIFVHRVSLKNDHNIWNLLGSNSAEEKGKSLSTIAIYVEKMKVCSGVTENRTQTCWDHGFFTDRGFVETGFYDSPVYRSNACHLLIDGGCPRDICVPCRLEWLNMKRMLSRNQKENIFDSKRQTKNDLEHALKRRREECEEYKKQIIKLQKDIDSLTGGRSQKESKTDEDFPISTHDDF